MCLQGGLCDSVYTTAYKEWYTCQWTNLTKYTHNLNKKKCNYLECICYVCKVASFSESHIYYHKLQVASSAQSCTLVAKYRLYMYVVEVSKRLFFSLPQTRILNCKFIEGLLFAKRNK